MENPKKNIDQYNEYLEPVTQNGYTYEGNFHQSSERCKETKFEFDKLG